MKTFSMVGVPALLSLALLAGLFVSAATCPQPAPQLAAKKSEITHSFLVAGHDRNIQRIDASGKVVWTFPSPASDVRMLENGNILAALYPTKKYPNGAVVEFDAKGKVVWEWKAAQNEISTAWPLENGNILTVELGKKPRLLELSREGKVVVDVPLKCQTGNAHMQTRMARKLPNGNYLVPHLLEKEVREYTPAGKIVWTAKTPNWPFTAIRLDNGNTVIGCTVGNVVVEVDPTGKVIWELSNKDLGSEMIKDACGVQRLPNGNTVVTSYRTGPGVKLIEVTPDKKLVWTYNDGTAHGIHEFQILETNGAPLTGRLLK